MSRSVLPAIVVIAACAPASPAAPAAPRGARPGPAALMPAVRPEARALGLEIGVTSTYSFSAEVAETGEGGDQRVRWSCLFRERIVGARDVEANGARWTVVEVRRAIDDANCDAPQHDWALTPRPGRIFFILGGTATTHDAVDYEVTRDGLAVYRQEHSLDLDALDDATLEYVLPLRIRSLWHFEPEARRDAASGEKIITMSRRVEVRETEVRTPGGIFHDCWRLSTWASANANDVSWVCDGAGEVRRTLERFSGSLRFTARSTLVCRSSPPLQARGKLGSLPERDGSRQLVDQHGCDGH